MDGYLDRSKCLKRSKARQRCSTLAYGNRSRFSGAEHMLAGAPLISPLPSKSIFQVKVERCRCFDRGAQKRSHVGWRYRVINIGRIAVADSILISDGCIFISFCSLSHYLSVSVCICLLHSRRSSRANRARNLAQGGCPDGCWDDYGSVYCDSPDCQGWSECYHDQTGPPGTSGEGTALLKDSTAQHQTGELPPRLYNTP